MSNAISNVLDLHSETIVAVSCSVDYATFEWVVPRQFAHSLLRDVLVSDIDTIASAIVNLTNMAVTIKPDELESLLQPIHGQLWQSVYRALRGEDFDSTRLLVSIAARASKMDKLHPKAYTARFWKHQKQQGNSKDPPKELLRALDGIIVKINDALNSTRDGFLFAMERFALANSSKQVCELLEESNMVQDIWALMLSPADDLHAGAQALVEQAFDVDGRKDCFLKLLERHPESSLTGLRTYVEGFNVFARTSAEACSLSKALVRCMTDVIEVLGVPEISGGLLKSQKFIEGVNSNNPTFLSNELGLFWKAVTTATSVIFKFTSHWAVYFENEAMVEWMRDALIFGRELLNSRRTFEAAANFASGQESSIASPRKPSGFGKRMVNDLQGILVDLQSWLRLVDMELLFQSFELLKSLMDCFRDAAIRPAGEALSKLRRFVDANRKSSDNRVSYLDAAKLAELDIFISDFEDDEDVVLLPDNVGRKLFEDKGKKGPNASSSSSSSKSTISQKTVEAEKMGRKRGRESSSDADDVIIISSPTPTVTAPLKQKKLLPSFKKTVRKEDIAPVVPLAKKRSPYDPKSEGRVGLKKPAREESSSSEESDSDEERMGIAELARLQDSPEKKARPAPAPGPKKPEERRQVKLIEDPRITQKNAMQQRIDRRDDAHRNAMRLRPDISPLHRTILAWDYDHNGTQPPYGAGQKPNYVHIPDRFQDHREFVKVFQPLLMLECWAQIVKSKDETAPDSYECKISGRSYVDDWIDFDVDFTEPVKHDWRLTDVDVVLLRNAVSGKSFMGKIGGCRRSPMGVHASFRCSSSNQTDGSLTANVGTIWRMSVVFRCVVVGGSVLSIVIATHIGLQFEHSPSRVCCFDRTRILRYGRHNFPPMASRCTTVASKRGV